MSPGSSEREFFSNRFSSAERDVDVVLGLTGDQKLTHEERDPSTSLKDRQILLIISFCHWYSSSSTGNGNDAPMPSQHRHVSLANIATAFLSERKSSSRRQTSGRRKKRLTPSEKKSGSIRRQSNFGNPADVMLAQRLSGEKVEGGIATILMVNGSANGGNNKHRTTMVRNVSVLKSSPASRSSFPR